ncbi:dipeptidase [Candidatus Bipolaricaulota bacterium]
MVGGDRAFPRTDAPSPWDGTLGALAQFWHGASATNDGPFVLRTAADIDRASPDRPGFLLGIEGVGPCFETSLGDPLAALQVLVQLGVRSLQLLGGEPRPIFEPRPTTEAPLHLRGMGRELIVEANRLGLLIDLAHMNGDEPAFAEIIDVSASPPIASHHCRAVNGCAEALSDDATRTLAKAGGVVGTHLGSHWLSGEDRQGTIDDLVSHIEHIVDLVGVDFAGLGTSMREPFRWIFRIIFSWPGSMAQRTPA